MGIRVEDLRRLIKEVLTEVELYSKDAEELLMMTAATESRLGHYLYQVNGIAKGIFQIEPNTHIDLWENYLKYRKEKQSLVKHFDSPSDFDLVGNIPYQIITARMQYYRVPKPLPNKSNILDMAAYYKEHWNTIHGKGSRKKAVRDYAKYVLNYSDDSIEMLLKRLGLSLYDI